MSRSETLLATCFAASTGEASGAGLGRRHPGAGLGRGGHGEPVLHQQGALDDAEQEDARQTAHRPPPHRSLPARGASAGAEVLRTSSNVLPSPATVGRAARARQAVGRQPTVGRRSASAVRSMPRSVVGGGHRADRGGGLVDDGAHRRLGGVGVAERTARATSSCRRIASGLGAAASCRGGCGRRAPRPPRRRGRAASRCRRPRAGSGGRSCRPAGRRRGRRRGRARPCRRPPRPGSRALVGVARSAASAGGDRLDAAAQLATARAAARSRSPPSSRQRITPGVEDVPGCRGWMVMPTRRRDATRPIDSSTRIASRDDAARDGVLVADAARASAPARPRARPTTIRAPRRVEDAGVQARAARGRGHADRSSHHAPPSVT